MGADALSMRVCRAADKCSSRPDLQTPILVTSGLSGLTGLPSSFVDIIDTSIKGYSNHNSHSTIKEDRTLLSLLLFGIVLY